MSGVTKYAGTARCDIVSSQLTGGAVSEGEVVFSVLFVHQMTCTCTVPVGQTDCYWHYNSHLEWMTSDKK